jgi:PAS domain S-box-containing protein
MKDLQQLRIQELGGGRTLAGIVTFMLLAIAAMTVVGAFAHLAALQNASARQYEAAITQLQRLLRGLDEAALTEGTLASLDDVKSGLKGFRALRSGSVKLDADSGDAWPGLDREIEELMRNRRNIAFDNDAMIKLGRVTQGLGELGEKLLARAEAEREGAAAAELRIQIANFTAGALMILGTAAFLVIRDNTAKKVLGLVLASEAQLRDITDAVPALIGYVDTERRYRFHNRGYHDVFGLSSDAVQGRTMLEVFGAANYEEMRPHVDAVLSGVAVRYERTQANAQGLPRTFAAHYFPRFDEQHAKVIGFYALTTDITDMKRIDRMKSEFISIVSHELRTPLTSIRGSLGLIAGGMAGKLPDTAKSLIDIAKNNCERLVRLINDILDSEKIESGKMRFDLNVVELEALVAQSITANAGFAVQQGVSLKLVEGGEGARVNVDRESLGQVLANLLSNAVKFSPPGGTVEVALRRAEGRVRVEVRDRGPGLQEEFRARIFQKFSQADTSDTRQNGGTGLGLNISKAIVERLGGTMGFATAGGDGTTFFFELPEWRDAPASVFAAGSRALKRACVLVCEDDPDIARLIGMMLDRAGYDTDLADTAGRARELAFASPYAAMTVDLRLPGEDGIRLMRSLRQDERTRELPIVMVSAISDEGRIRLNSESFSVSDWLGKPIDANRLVAAIRDAVAGRAHDRPRILHVEDGPDMQHLSAAIARDFATFEFAATLQEARVRLGHGRYDLVVLDLNLPEGEGSGWNLLDDIDALVPSPPVVVFSANDLSGARRERVAAVLVKAQTSNEKFLETIERVLGREHHAPAKPLGAEIAQAA